MGLFENIETMNKTLNARSTKRKSFIKDVLNGTQDDNDFTALLAAKTARDQAAQAAAPVLAPPGPAPAPSLAPTPSAVGGGHFVGDGHNHGSTSSADAKKVNPQFNSALQKFLKESGGRISIGNSYRSPERQAQLWEAALRKYGSAAKARRWVAPPGKSNHGRGLAADLKYVDKSAIAWAHANAKRYGLHFPLSNENWHIEPVSARKKK